MFHDGTLDRMTGSDGRIADHTAADLGGMRLAGTDETIPTLADTLTLVGHRAMVHIEIKTPYGEVGPLERRVCEILIDHNGPTCVIGFNPYSHAWFAEHHPKILRGLDSYSYANGDARHLAPELRRAYARLEHVAGRQAAFPGAGRRHAAQRQGRRPSQAAECRSSPGRFARPTNGSERQGPLRQLDLRGLRRVTGLRSGRCAYIGGSPRSDARPGTPARRPRELPANPFVAFDFLDILEESGCAVARTGWAPRITWRSRTMPARVAAVMPLYLKSHSQGEYVFDHAWADAYERAGGRYYPKLVAPRRSRR